MLFRSLKFSACLLLAVPACDVAPNEPTDEPARSAAGGKGDAIADAKDQADDECKTDDDCEKGESCTPGYCPIWCSDKDPDCCVPNLCEAPSGSGDACKSDDDCAKGETCEPGYCPFWCPVDNPDCCVDAMCVAT